MFFFVLIHMVINYGDIWYVGGIYLFDHKKMFFFLFYSVKN